MSEKTTCAVEYRHVFKSYGEKQVLDDFNLEKWLRTSGITAGIPVAAPLHHMDERLMHPEDRGTRWRRVMQAD